MILLHLQDEELDRVPIHSILGGAIGYGTPDV